VNSLSTGDRNGLVRVVCGPNERIFAVAGKTVGDAKTVLRDLFNIGYFAVAIVNGSCVELSRRLADGDSLEFVLPVGVKGAGDKRKEQFAEALVDSSPNLRAIAEYVKSLALERDDAIDLTVALVGEHCVRAYGCHGAEERPILSEVVQVLVSVKDRINELDAKFQALLDLVSPSTATSPTIPQAIPVGPVLEFRFDGMWHLRFQAMGHVESATLPDEPGLAVYGFLLERPNKFFPAAVVLVEIGRIKGAEEHDARPDQILDQPALATIRKEIERLKREIDDTADPERQAELEEESRQLVHSQNAALSPSGNLRTFGFKRLDKRILSQLKRARFNIAKQMPEFAKYLPRTVRSRQGDFAYHP